jgi:hypothetical protein
LPLNITDVRIASADGSTNASLLDNGKFPNLGSGDHSFVGRLTSDQFPIHLPYQVTQNFIKTLSAVPSGLSDGSLRINKTFNGNMTFTLSDGFQVTIPSDVLYNATGLSPVADRKQDDNSPFYLSLPFLAQIYLMMDYESSVFHVATAVQENVMVMPTPFCPHSTPTAYATPAASSFKKKGLIGALIGGIIGLIVLSTLGFFIVKMCIAERKIQKQEKAERVAETAALNAKRTLQKIQTMGFEPMEEIREGDKERTPLVRRVKFWV